MHEKYNLLEYLGFISYENRQKMNYNLVMIN